MVRQKGMVSDGLTVADKDATGWSLLFVHGRNERIKDSNGCMQKLKLGMVPLDLWSWSPSCELKEWGEFFRFFFVPRLMKTRSFRCGSHGVFYPLFGSKLPRRPSHCFLFFLSPRILLFSFSTCLVPSWYSSNRGCFHAFNGNGAKWCEVSANGRLHDGGEMRRTSGPRHW